MRFIQRIFFAVKIEKKKMIYYYYFLFLFIYFFFIYLFLFFYLFILFIYFFFFFAQNRDCEYTLKPPRPGGSNEYPQYMFWIKNKENMYTSVNSIFTI